MRIKRRNMIWLGVLAALTGIAVISSGLSAPASLALLGALGVAGGVALFDLEPRALIKTVQEKTALGGKVSADAREATERARARGGGLIGDMLVLDIGLIALDEGYDGMVMQRTRNLSLDHNGVRPYLTLQVPPIDADRRAMIRFEMDDGHGKKVYIHEQEMYLRDGTANILADNQMPLFNSDLTLAHGDGDLRVYVDGILAGVLGFKLAPSTRDRWAGRRQKHARQRLSDNEPAAKDDDAPISLEELLRQQNGK